MLTVMPTRLVTFTASPSALRRRVPRIGSRYLSKATENAIRVDAALGDHLATDRYRRILGRTDRIGSLQSPSNPHTSTALPA
jgi:hypothetical protein